MNEQLKVSSSPHIRDKVTTSNIMLMVVIALLPATFFGIYNFRHEHAWVLVVVTTLTAVATEYIYERLMHKTITIKDLYGVIGLPQTPANKYNVLNAMGLTEFLAGMTGVTLSQEQIKRTYLEAAAVGKGMYIINTPVRLVKRIENSIMVGASNLYKKGIDKIWNMMVVD